MDSEITNTIRASFIGNMARVVLSGHSSASVQGISSGGIYIKTDRNWVMYITGAPYRGPLTIGVKRYEAHPLRLVPGMTASIQSDRLYFPESGLAISTRDSRVWEPQPPKFPPLPLAKQSERWRILARGILESHPGADIETALRALLADPGTPQTITETKGFLSGNIQGFFDPQERRDLEDIPNILSKSIGKGPGLTPGGDDLIAGVLLSLNRWKPPNLIKDRLDVFNKEIVHRAYQKTTTLSANLIECAAKGLADERLINALDWIKSGGPHEMNTLIEGLLGWGNTSGVEAFTGYLFALNIQGNGL